MGRSLPGLPADLLSEKDAWQAAYVLNKKAVPPKVPQFNGVARLIARLGGSRARRAMVSGEPRRCGWGCATLPCLYGARAVPAGSYGSCHGGF